MKRLTPISLMLCLAFAAGCGSKGNKQDEPLALEKFTAEQQLKKEWSVTVGNGQGKLWNSLTPALSDSTLLVADSRGLVVALDRFNGKQHWQRKLKIEVSGGVGADGERALLGTLAGEVIALDVHTGETLWTSRVGSEILSAPASNGQIVVVQTQDDRIIALDARTGAREWIYESTPAVLTLRGSSTPLVTAEAVFAGLSTGKVVALEARQGLPVWEQRVAVPSGRTELERMVDINGDLYLRDGVLYVAAFQGQMAALDWQSGRVLWQREASSANGVAYGFGSAYLSLVNGELQGVDERSTALVWSNRKLLNRQPGSPEVLSSYLAVADYEGYLHLLSQVDGRFVARTRVDSKGVRVRPLVEGGWMYVYGNSGKLMALTIE